MSDTVQLSQSTKEALIFPINWVHSMYEGDTIIDVTITHVPPSGDPAVFSKSVASPYSYIGSPKNLAVGTHKISVVATTDHVGLEPEVYILLMVDR